MTYDLLDAKAQRSVASPQIQVLAKPAPRLFRRTSVRTGAAERVAIRMIARHGANAAREATVRLNRMIDRGDFAARDLWACVVHVIHRQQGEGEIDPPRAGRRRTVVKPGELAMALRKFNQYGRSPLI